MSSTDLTTRQTEEALIASAKAGLGDTSDLVVPMLKVMQPLSAEVQEGDASPGELVHSLTGESYGESVGLVIVQAFKGRFWSKDGRGYAASGHTIPWRDHPDYGKPFVDSLDSEEQHRARVNAGEIEWGKGPAISTTFNFVALPLRNDELENFPVRLSLMRSAAKAGRKLTTLLQITRAPWDHLYTVETVKAASRRGEKYIAVNVSQERSTTAEERQAAVAIAQQIAQGGVELAEPEVESEAEAPAETGGLSV